MERSRLTDPPPADDPKSRLAVFAFLWAVYSLFHQADNGWAASPLDLLESVAAIALLVRPRELSLFLLLHIVQATELFYDLPVVSNHTVAHVAMSLTILTAALLPRVRVGTHGSLEGRLYSFVAPILRVELLIAYGWAVFHKLNSDFLYPPISAATTHFQMLSARIERVAGVAIPTPDALLALVVFSTLAAEASVVLLLSFPRTRLAGVAVGLLFHFILGVNNFFDFSAFLYAVFFLFTPANFVGVVARTWNGTLNRTIALYGATALRDVRPEWLVCGGVLLWIVAIGNAWTYVHPSFWMLWVPYGACVILVFFSSSIGWMRAKPVFEPVRVTSAVCALFPALLLLNGASPYFGLKTRTCFAMFSNLRTELRWPGDRSNHLIVPDSWKLWSFQEDLVLIESSSVPWLTEVADRGSYYPFFEFKRTISSLASHGVRNIHVAYVRNGTRFETSAAELEPELATPHPYLMGKLLTFGEVSSQPRQPNRW